MNKLRRELPIGWSEAQSNTFTIPDTSSARFLAGSNGIARLSVRILVRHTAAVR